MKRKILRLRHLERLPLGTPYPDVVARVRNMVRSPDMLGRCQLMVDATGVGPPVVDTVDVMRTIRGEHHYNWSWTFVPISRAIAMAALPYSIRTCRIAFH